MLDLRGHKYTRMTPVEPTLRRVNRSVVWLCKCDCGRTKEATSNCLRTGYVKSCGCLNLESQILTHTKHGMADSPTCQAWKDMLRRCNNPNSINWARYGGRGIKVCVRWRSFVVFLRDMGPRPDGMSLERMDNDGNYCPENCIWVPLSKQARNTCRTRWIERGGKRMSLAEAAEESGLKYRTIQYRLNKGWGFEDSFTINPRRKAAGFPGHKPLPVC